MKAAVAKSVLARSGGICERCRDSAAHHLHHRVTRARGGPDHAANLAHLCAGCHRVAHSYNQAPWLADGYFLRGVYHGTDPLLASLFGVESEAIAGGVA